MSRNITLAVALVVLSICVSARAQETAPATEPTSRAVVPEPTRVTLKFEGAEPLEVFSSLAEQGQLTLDDNTKFLLGKDHGRLPGVDLKQVPFWDALHALTENSDYVFHGVTRDGALSLSQAPVAVVRQPTVVSGPFMVAITRIDLNLAKSLDFAGRAPGNVLTNRYAAPPCRIYMYASAEPRLKPIHWYVDSLECTGNDGQVLMPMREFGAGVVSGDVNSPNETQLRFESSFEGVKVISTLRLNARLLLEGKRQTLEIEDPLKVKNATYTIGGFRVVFVGLNHVVDNRYGYSVAAYRDGKDKLAWEQFRSIFDRFHPKILDADGHELQSMGGGGMYSGDRIENNSNLTGASAPVKIVWSFPTELRQVTFPLEFKNIPLP